MESDDFAPFLASYRAWLETEEVPEDAARVPEALCASDPMKLLFLGLVEWRASAYGDAARHILAACRTGNVVVMRSAAVSALREMCSPGFTFFESSTNDISAELPETAEARLAKVLESYVSEPCDDDARPSTQKKQRRGGDDKLSSVSAATFLRGRLSRKGNWQLNQPIVRIMKLLFYADALNIFEKGTTLLDAVPVAKKDGPVYEDARQALKALWKADAPGDVPCAAEGPLSISPEHVALLERVCDSLDGFATAELTLLSHLERPWLEAAGRAARTGEETVPISKDTMLAWFDRDAGALVPTAILGLVPTGTESLKPAISYAKSIEPSDSTLS